VAQIFVSYASEDIDVVVELVRLFEGQGWTVWWDRRIGIGEDYSDEIEAELDRAKCVVVVWSRHSAQSRWVRNEAEDAANRGAVVPVLISEVRVPLSMRSLEAARLFDWPNRDHPGEIRKLLTAVDVMLAPDSEPKVAERSWQLDPTLSERVARRVVEALRKAKQGEHDI
jgi:adenylate cyclase